jgi:hypothetical protein
MHAVPRLVINYYAGMLVNNNPAGARPVILHCKDCALCYYTAHYRGQYRVLWISRAIAATLIKAMIQLAPAIRPNCTIALAIMDALLYSIELCASFVDDRIDIDARVHTHVQLLSRVSIALANRDQRIP